MQAALKLSTSFDPTGLRQDVDSLTGSDWIKHFDTGIYSGDWSGLALRGPADAAHPIQALHNAPGTTDFADQPVLQACPHLRRAIQALPCPLTSVRLLRLGPGAEIAEHTDHELGYDFGEVRLHVPIVTSPEVDFRVEGRRIVMRPGEVWYLDASRPHAVINRGDQARVHLVLDCRVNDWLRAELEAADAAQADPAPALSPPPVAGSLPVSGRPGAPPDDMARLMERILAFLQQIGIPADVASVPGDTFLPGVQIAAGRIRVDPERLLHPGDLLHEAGHIAVTPAAERPGLNDQVGTDPADEMMAIAWSWAALTHLQLDPQVVFHEAGYKGDAQWLIETFSSGSYIALPMLQWIGLTADAERASELGVDPYPHMLRWLRE